MNYYVAIRAAKKAFVLFSFLGIPQILCGLRQVDIPGQTVVAERRLGMHAEAVIAVDADDVVHELTIDPESKIGEVTLDADLGVRVLNSGHLSLATVIPKDKVATLARRLSLSNGITVHVIIAWGYSKYPEILTPRCDVYIFREQRGGVKQVVGDELGAEIQQLVVADINHDEKTEVLVVSSENEEESMDIWQIQRDGEVKKIQRISGYRVYTLADRFLGKGQGIIVEEKMHNGCASGVCLQIEEYTWSVKEQKFVKSGGPSH